MEFRKTVFRCLLLLFLTFVSAEVSLFTYFKIRKRSYLFKEASTYTISRRELRGLREIFDADLGWTFPFNTRYGERSSPFKSASNYAVTFGDSFTYGSQVDDLHTWQTALEKKVGERVLNFGVPGYGIDQAVLRFMKVSPTIKARYAILGMISPDIPRSMTIYPNFLHGLQWVYSITKPRFTLIRGRLSLIPNPIQSKQDLAKLMNPAFIKKIEKLDWLRANYDYPSFSFPYTHILFDPAFQKQLDGSFMEEFWDAHGEKIRIINEILALFASTACANQQIPIIVLYPEDSMTNLRYAKFSSHYFRQTCNEMQLNCFFPVEDFEGAAPMDRLFFNYDGNHFTPAGTELFAKLLGKYLDGIDEEYSRDSASVTKRFCRAFD